MIKEEVAATIKIISCCSNAEQWIANTINSVKKQSYANFEFFLYLDACSDRTKENALKAISDDPRFFIFEGQYKIYSGIARWKLLTSLRSAHDKDIIVLLDGDDWLSSDESLAILTKFYSRKEIVATHGNYMTEKGVLCSWATEYDLQVKIRNQYRDAPWIATHLRSFKYGLFKYLREDILFTNVGLPFKSATDMALFLPILELSGAYTKFIDQPLYIYNTKNGLVMEETRVLDQRLSVEQIRRKDKYEPLSYSELKHMM